MAGLETPRELRRAMRVQSKGSIQIRRGRRLIPGRLVDLSVGGICVRTAVPIELAGVIGKPVSVRLRHDARPFKQFALLGRVLRVNAETGSIAIGFDAVPAEFEASVQDELLAAAAHDSLPRMLLVDALGERRSTIADAFRSAGCHVTEAATPLEAIAHLGRSQFELGLIAVADTVPETVAEQLRAFLLNEHPGAHMIAIGRSAAHRPAAESWLSSASGGRDLQIRVGRVVIAHGARRRSTMSSMRPAASRDQPRHPRAAVVPLRGPRGSMRPTRTTSAARRDDSAPR